MQTNCSLLFNEKHHFQKRHVTCTRWLKHSLYLSKSNCYILLSPISIIFAPPSYLRFYFFFNLIDLFILIFLPVSPRASSVRASFKCCNYYITVAMVMCDGAVWLGCIYGGEWAEDQPLCVLLLAHPPCGVAWCGACVLYGRHWLNNLNTLPALHKHTQRHSFPPLTLAVQSLLLKCIKKDSDSTF